MFMHDKNIENQEKVFVTMKKKNSCEEEINHHIQAKETNTSSKCALERFCVVQAFHK